MRKQSIVFIVCILGLHVTLSVANAGTIYSRYKYAWSNNSGYVNFEQTTVSDTALGGYAWSTNDGWIKLDPTMGGVLNDGNGDLSGYAWGENAGWIDFNGVRIDPEGLGQPNEAR